MTLSLANKIFIAVIFFLIPLIGQSANISVSPTGTGTESGADWDNTMGWDTITFVRGNTYYLVNGTFDGKKFDTVADGTTYITIRKATASNYSDVSSTGWNATYAEQAVFINNPNGSTYAGLSFKTPYWIIDGVTGGGPSSWTSGFGFKVYWVHDEAASGGVVGFINLNRYSGSSASNITISHVDIGNPTQPGVGCDTAIYNVGTNSPNITIDHCYVHHTGDMAFLSKDFNGWVVEYNRFEQPSNAGSCGTCCTGDSHGTTMQIEGTVGGTIRYNYFTDSNGTGVIGYYNTDNTMDGMKIYGNIFADGIIASNGFIYNTSGTAGMINTLVYNNTFVDSPVGAGAVGSLVYFMNTATGNVFTNNLVYNVTTTGGVLGATNTYTATDVTLGGTNEQIITSAIFTNYVTNDFSLASNTTAGTNLGSPYNTDILSSTRTTWSRGAYEYGGTSPIIYLPFRIP